MKFIHGWNRDSEAKKVKDYNATLLLDLVPARPTAASVRQYILSILDQQNLGSCVTNAGAQGVRAALVKAGDAQAKLLSRLFAYYYARAIDPGNTQVDSGTQIRCFFDAIARVGYCPEDVWPYDISKFTKMPGWAALRAAFDQKVSVGYYRISSTGQQRIEDICTAIAGGYAVVFGTLVGNEFMGYVTGAAPLNPPGKSLGGHALCAVGYQPGPVEGAVDFDICNSYGPEWGDQGFCTMTDTYMAWSETDDLWIAKSMPDFADAPKIDGADVTPVALTA
jgi:C1A family cysteine protease